MGDSLKLVDKITDSLKGSPILLVLVLVNLTVLALVGYLVDKSAEYRFKERAEILALLRDCSHLSAPGLPKQ